MAQKTALAAATTYDLDPAHASVDFRVKHLMIANVTGKFRLRSGEIAYDPADPSGSRVVAEIDAASVETGAADRDKHLRSPDFLDVDQHPTLRFESRRVEPQGPDRARVVGDLTIRGVTREVALDVEKDGEAVDPWGGRRAAFTATTTIDRREWGLTWNAALEAGGFLVGDNVKVTLSVQGVERKA